MSSTVTRVYKQRREGIELQFTSVTEKNNTLLSCKKRSHQGSKKDRIILLVKSVASEEVWNTFLEATDFTRRISPSISSFKIFFSGGEIILFLFVDLQVLNRKPYSLSIFFLLHHCSFHISMNKKNHHPTDKLIKRSGKVSGQKRKN